MNLTYAYDAFKIIEGFELDFTDLKSDQYFSKLKMIILMTMRLNEQIKL